MIPAYALKLGLVIRKIDVGVQKIDGFALTTYGMVIAGFLLQDKLGRVWFFEETFLLADTSMEVVLGMPFLSLSNVDIRFVEREITWRRYTTAKALLTTQRMKLINKKEFAAAALDADSETFVVHVTALDIEGTNMAVHPFRAAQIGLLKANEASTIVPTKYSDYTDVFSSELAIELPKHISINDHAIELEDGKQPPYGPIYSLGPVELETLKAYMKTNLTNNFIKPFKSPAGAPIFFDRKPNGSLCLCVDYCGLNNLIIKNRYPLALISESFNCLGRAKRFTQLDLTNTYHWIRIREGNEWKTAFRTRYGHFEYQVMPFGLSNAPATF